MHYTFAPNRGNRVGNGRPLSIPVILGTSRKGRMSAHAARFVCQELQKREGVQTELIDIAGLEHNLDENGRGTGDPTFAASMARADGIVIVAPEYNHAMPGLLKHVLDSCLPEYIHKAAGIVAISAGPFGGTRVIETSLPVLRELGLVTIFWDVNVGSVAKVFDEGGMLLDNAFVRRTEKFLSELIWMARTLRYGRENIPLN
jgi:NAD(P)H-dependent FMN reductase